MSREMKLKTSIGEKEKSKKDYYDKISFKLGDRYKIELEFTIKTKKNKNYIDYETMNPVKEYKTLSIYGQIYDNKIKREDKISFAGQIKNTIREIMKKERIEAPSLEKILNIWDKYHLNELTPGTKRQMEAIEKEEQRVGNTMDYEEAVSFLEKIGLLKDKENMNYKFGQSWLLKPLPEKLEEELKELSKKVNNKTFYPKNKNFIDIKHHKKNSSPKPR